MLDLLAGRCLIHGWLSAGELAAGICWRCHEPDFDDEDDPKRLVATPPRAQDREAGDGG